MKRIAAIAILVLSLAGLYFAFKELSTGTLLGTKAFETKKEYYVSATGKSPAQGGNGSQSNPWDLKSALLATTLIRPGDTVWIRGGTYRGTFSLKLKGQAGSPVIVRNYNNERVILDNHDYILDVCDASHVYVWGLEFTDSSNSRSLPVDGSAYGIRVNQGCASNNVTFINNIVHDVQAQGFGFWSAATDSELYGNIIYYNGISQLEHGIYVTNNNGTKRITDNFIFNNAAYGIHAYSENDAKYLDNLIIEGNIVFNNSSIGFNTSSNKYGVYKGNIIVGGANGRPATNLRLTSNFTYYPSISGRSLSLGYKDGTVNAVVEDNYFIGGAIGFVGPQTNLQFKNNTILASSLTGLTQSQYPGNSWGGTAATTIKVRANKYETGRYHLVIYNKSKSNEISLDQDIIGQTNLKIGDAYEIRNVEDYFNEAAYIRGKYDGNPIRLKMSGYTIAQPTGLNFKPNSMLPAFGAFILINKSSNLPVTPIVTKIVEPTKIPTATIKPNATAVPTRTITSIPTTIPRPTALPTVKPLATPTQRLVPVTPVPTKNPVSQPTTLYPQEDAAVRKDHPDTNLGSSKILGIDGNPRKITYLKFFIPSGVSLNSSELSLHTEDEDAAESSDTFSIHTITCDWNEKDITYNNKPQAGTFITSFRGSKSDRWKNVDVSSAIKTSGQVCLSISSEGSNGLDLSSRESDASLRPRLVIK